MGNAIKELHKDGLEKLIVAGINTLIVENKDASNKSHINSSLSVDCALGILLGATGEHGGFLCAYINT